VNDVTSKHRRWVGSFLSLLLPGTGVYLSGDRRNGIYWFLALTGLWLVVLVVGPLPSIPGLFAWAASYFCLLVGIVWMLVKSYRPVPKQRLAGWTTFLALVLGYHLTSSFVQNQLSRTFKITTGDMTPALMPGDALISLNCAYWFGKPQRGDVVVFATRHIESPLIPQDTYYVKRIAALPGEEVRVLNGYLTVNGSRLGTSPVVTEEKQSLALRGLFAATNTFVVPPDTFFVLGDNFTNSYDSRHFGAVPRRSLVGRATKIYWPLAHAGDLQ
jgi:signal peptidase I